MDEQQFHGYLELIYSLLTCEAVTKQIIYQQYSQLIDEFLPKSMLHFAKQYKQVEEPLKIAWLRREAGILSTRIEEWKQLNRQAVELYQQGERASAIPLAKQALGLARNIFPSPNKNLTASLINIAEMYFAQEQWADAVPFYEEFIAIYPKLHKNNYGKELAPYLASLGTCLAHLGQMYRDLGQWADAVPFYEKVLAIHKTLFGDRPTEELLIHLTNIGYLYYLQSRWDMVKPPYEEALAIYKTLYKDRPSKNLVACLNQLALAYHYGGDWEKAQLYFEEALAIIDEFLSDEMSQEELATILNNTADLYRCQTNWDEAKRLCKKALSIRQNLFGKLPNEGLAVNLNSLAEIYRAQGKWVESEPLYEEAVAMRRTLYGNNPNKYLATSLNDLGALYLAKRDLNRAKLYFEEALDIRRIVYHQFPNNDLAISLNNVAIIYANEGNWSKVKSLYEEKIAIHESLAGDMNNLNIVITLNNLAGICIERGELAEAKIFCEKALIIIDSSLCENLLSTKHSIASIQQCLGVINYAQGKSCKAIEFYEKSLTTFEILFGETGHPILFTCLSHLALAHARQQRSDKALSIFQQVIEAENNWMTNIIATSDTQHRLQYLQRQEPYLERLLSLTQQYFLNNSQIVTNTLNAVLSRKALTATAEATFTQAIRNYPHLTPQIEQYKTYQQEIANLSHAIGSQPELKDRLNAVLQQKRDLEKNLARSIPAIDLAQQVIDRQALTELLPAEAFLVEFVRYDDYDFINAKWQPARYLAFIVRHDRTGVTAIDCGLAKPLDVAIDKFRRAYADTKFKGESSNFSSAKRNTSSTANTATLEPVPTIVQPDLLALLLPHFPTTGICYVAPDSKLHILPFHLLKTDDGKYLGDRYHIHYLTTARDLYRRNFPNSENPPIILADPDYDGGIIPTVAVSPKTGIQGSHNVNGAAFDRLEINRILGDRVAKRYDVPCYSDLDATVDRLERLNAPRLLAIATHGFSQSSLQDFIDALTESKPEEEERILRDRQTEITQEFRDFWQALADAGNEWSQRLLVKIDNIGIYKSTDLLATHISDPMLRSGIALAGANIWRFQGTPDPKFGKGVAFAHDIAQWDLWGTELAVMITCVSGMGEVRESEGVFGLRRALAIAGAKYTISSLWNIKTKPSVLLMDKFFELYQSEDRPTPPQALAQAQTYVRNITLGELNQLEIGLAIVEELQRETVRKLSLTATDDVKPLADPHFWGAWICQG
jgi:tetratricopeptide (TPR) repeat protein